jgi:antagonist of KipI
MSILIQKSGILSTIQDLGRKGYQQFGVNPNGAMDSHAVRLINILLGNDEAEAVLEMHFPAPDILFEADAIFALGGADFSAKINDKPIENWRSFSIKKNQFLNFTKKTLGSRAYLSVKGGFKIKKWLGSTSTNLLAKIGGFDGRSLTNGDRIFFNSKPKIQNLKFPYKVSKSLIPHYNAFPVIRIIAGAEFEELTALSEQNFLKQTFTICNDSDRMGFRLQGEPLHLLNAKELVSSAVSYGTIQLLPDGQTIILMADHQTSGGYPRIAHVISTDLPVLAQLGAKDKVEFEMISLQLAEHLRLHFEKDLNLLKLGCQFKNSTGK